MYALLLAEQGRCHAASGTASNNSHEDQHEPTVSSNKGSAQLTASKAVSQQDSSCPDAVWDQASLYAQEAVQAFAACAASDSLCGTAQMGKEALEGLLSPTDLMTELLFLMGLHGELCFCVCNRCAVPICKTSCCCCHLQAQRGLLPEQCLCGWANAFVVLLLRAYCQQTICSGSHHIVSGCKQANYAETNAQQALQILTTHWPWTKACTNKQCHAGNTELQESAADVLSTMLTEKRRLKENKSSASSFETLFSTPDSALLAWSLVPLPVPALATVKGTREPHSLAAAHRILRCTCTLCMESPASSWL